MCKIGGIDGSQISKAVRLVQFRPKIS